jgi:hypothetical protein
MSPRVKRFKNPAGVRSEAESWIAELKDSDRTERNKSIELIIKFFNIWLRAWEIEGNTTGNPSEFRAFLQEMRKDAKSPDR